MNKKRAFYIVPIALLFVAGSLTYGDEKDAKKNTPDATDDPVEVRFGKLIKAQSLLGKPITREGSKTVGKVSDLVLDLETGHVALVVAEIPEKNASAFMALPWRILKGSEQGFELGSSITDSSFSKARRFDESSLATLFNRAWAVVEYSTFGNKPYWAEDKLADRSKFDERDYRLTLLSELKDVPVQDQDGKEMGTIDGFAVSVPLGRIAFAAVRLNDDPKEALYPLPLGAFVVESADKPWKVELEKEAIINSPSLAALKYPPKLDRRWVEYVHVRYGQSPLGGVQHHERQ